MDSLNVVQLIMMLYNGLNDEQRMELTEQLADNEVFVEDIAEFQSVYLEVVSLYGLEYDEQNSERSKVLDELVSQAQELNMGYEK